MALDPHQFEALPPLYVAAVTPEGLTLTLALDDIALSSINWAAITDTTVTATIATSSQTVTPDSMDGIWEGVNLTVDTSTSQETVEVTDATDTDFTAVFTKAHSGTWAVVGALTNVGGVLTHSYYPGTWFVINNGDGTMTFQGNTWILDPNLTVLTTGVYYGCFPAPGPAPDGVGLVGVIDGVTSGSLTVTVKQLNPAVTVSSVTEVDFDKATGLGVAAGGAGIAVVSGIAATTVQMGMVTAADQGFSGVKTFSATRIEVVPSVLEWISVGVWPVGYASGSGLDWHYSNLSGTNIITKQFFSYQFIGGPLGPRTAQIGWETFGIDGLGNMTVHTDTQLCLYDSSPMIQPGGFGSGAAGDVFYGGLFIRSYSLFGYFGGLS